MYFRSYYLEIKNRSVLLAFLWSTVFFVSYCFKEALINIVLGGFSLRPFSFIFTDVIEVLLVYVHLIIFFVNQVFLLYVFYYFLLFFLPSLTTSESSFVVSGFAISVLLFFLSIIVFNKFLFPISLNFFLSFQTFDVLKSLSLDFEAKLLEYCLFYTKLYRMCVLHFQVFLIPVFFFRCIKDQLHIYSRFRKLLYYSLLVLSTTVTPPDILSQIMLSLGMVICCEVLVYCFAFQKMLVRELSS